MGYARTKLERAEAERDALKAKLEAAESQCEIYRQETHRWKQARDMDAESYKFHKSPAEYTAIQESHDEYKSQYEALLKRWEEHEPGNPLGRHSVWEWLDCVKPPAEYEALEKENEQLKSALKKIVAYPVHSEPVGGAMEIQDIAHAALSALVKEDGK